MAKRKNKDRSGSKKPEEVREDVSEATAEEAAGAEDEAEQTVADDSPPEMMAEAAADADEVVDEEDEDEDEAEGSEDIVPRSAEEVLGEAHRRGANIRAEFSAWPCDPDHASAAEVLRTSDGPEIDLTVDDDGGGGGARNLVLAIVLLAVAGAGMWQFQTVSSEETLAARRAEREAIEKAHMDDQLAKQKKYGTLRIESTPAQAKVLQLVTVGGAPTWQPMTLKNDQTGEVIEVLTPVNLNNMDISQKLQFRLTKDGYEETEFGVAEHLWVKDNATGEYKFLKDEGLTPLACEYYLLYDMSKRREMKFDTKEECDGHHAEALAAKSAVTDCSCKEMPVDEWLEREAKGKEEAEKAAKRGKKGKK